MSNHSSSDSRFQNCDGARIRKLRQLKGWTQAELAKVSGYSVRLIQKAESGGSLGGTTLEVLAKSLSNERSRVSINDLTRDSQSVVEEFIHLINEHFEAAPRVGQHLFAEQIRIWCAGDPQIMPFAGEWTGQREVEEFFKRFFAVLTPSETPFLRNMQFMANGNDVVAWGEAMASAGDVPPIPMQIWHHYHVRDGKIEKFENHYDTLKGSDYLARARAQEILQRSSA